MTNQIHIKLKVALLLSLTTAACVSGKSSGSGDSRHSSAVSTSSSNATTASGKSSGTAGSTSDDKVAAAEDEKAAQQVAQDQQVKDATDVKALAITELTEMYQGVGEAQDQATATDADLRAKKDYLKALYTIAQRIAQNIDAVEQVAAITSEEGAKEETDKRLVKLGRDGTLNAIKASTTGDVTPVTEDVSDAAVIIKLQSASFALNETIKKLPTCTGAKEIPLPAAPAGDNLSAKTVIYQLQVLQAGLELMLNSCLVKSAGLVIQ